MLRLVGEEAVGGLSTLVSFGRAGVRGVMAGRSDSLAADPEGGQATGQKSPSPMDLRQAPLAPNQIQKGWGEFSFCIEVSAMRGGVRSQVCRSGNRAVALRHRKAFQFVPIRYTQSYALVVSGRKRCPELSISLTEGGGQKYAASREEGSNARVTRGFQPGGTSP